MQSQAWEPDRARRSPRHVLRSVFARAGRQLGGGIIAGNSIILLLAWRADSLTADFLVTSVITSVIMAVVGVLACAPPARRALRVQPTEALARLSCFFGTSETALVPETGIAREKSPSIFPV